MRSWLTLALLASIASCAGPGPAATCHEVVVTSGHAAAATRQLGLAPVHLVSHDSAGCDCTPSLAIDPTTEVVSMQACGCSDARCVDQGYEATRNVFVSEGFGAGAVIQLTFEPALRTEIVDPARCVASTASISEIALLAPSPSLQGGGGDTWIDLRASDDRCCGTPLELVTPTVDGTTIDLAVLECHPDTCDCATGAPHDASTPVYLGDLAPGTYTVRAGAVTTTLTIP